MNLPHRVTISGTLLPTWIQLQYYQGPETGMHDLKIHIVTLIELSQEIDILMLTW